MGRLTPLFRAKLSPVSAATVARYTSFAVAMTPRLSRKCEETACDVPGREYVWSADATDRRRATGGASAFAHHGIQRLGRAALQPP